MSKINFAGVSENVISRDEFTLDKARETLSRETIAILGYGVQGPGQALNLRDNGFNVIIGQRQGSDSWQKALDDGWVPGETLFTLEAACDKGTFISCLLSDAGQVEFWPILEKYLHPGKTLCFSHGFAVTFSGKTGVKPGNEIDVVLVAPKGSGTSVRRLFMQGKGINASYAIENDASGQAFDKCIAYGVGIGTGYLFETDFKKEVYSDLTGERAVLMGAIAGLFEAQYEVLRQYGHSPSEAFNESVEELTQSLMPLVAEDGMDWLYKNCSTTAQRGALDWADKFKTLNKPLIDEIYQSVRSEKEAERVIKLNGEPDYREKLSEELNELANREIWQVGKIVRELRPEKG